jgi:hypothetical protein
MTAGCFYSGSTAKFSQQLNNAYGAAGNPPTGSGNQQKSEVCHTKEANLGRPKLSDNPQ